MINLRYAALGLGGSWVLNQPKLSLFYLPADHP